MMPQPYNQTKQFKRFSVEEVEDKVTSVLANNDDNKDDKEVSVNDPTVESFGSVQVCTKFIPLKYLKLTLNPEKH